MSHRGSGLAHSPGMLIALMCLLQCENARAGAAPDSTQSRRLTTANAAGMLLRVQTGREIVLASRVHWDDQFLRLPLQKGPPALVTYGRIPDSVRERSIPWAEVEQVDAGRSHVGRDFLVGAGVGLGLCAIAMTWSGVNMFEKGDNGAIGLTFLVGTLTGVTGLVVGMTHPEWRPLYP